MSILIHACVALGIALAIMGTAFVIAERLRFYSLVDVAWSFSFGVIAAVFGFMAQTFDQHWLLYGMTILWSLRLGIYILARLVAHYPREDGRYVELRERWAGQLTLKFALFFLVQALTIVVLSVPLILVASDPNANVGVLARIAILVWFVGVIGEAISDAQLRAFKLDPKNAGQVCNVGFWRLSRHPNYFFEWIIWCAFGLYALTTPYGVFSLVAPILMFYLLNYVSGIPPSEAQSIKTKGERYTVYMQRTNRFFPWMRKAKH